MELIASMLIPRHCVSRDAAGLSTMQAALLGSPDQMDAMPAVTAVIAPTGSGKSHVYRKAVQRNERVLFVVPTKRLGQNLAASFREDLIADGWPPAVAEAKIQRWDGDTAARMLEAGETEDVRLWRRERFPLLAGGQKGELIVTTPETLSGLLFGANPKHGNGDVGPNSLMSCFDRIIFDEAHLIQPRGFGLVSLCAGLASNGPWGRDGTGPVRAKVSLLSATPIDVAPVLKCLGVPDYQIGVIREVVTPSGGRALHGDVTVDFVMADSLLEIFEATKADVQALPDGQCALILYDALKTLLKDQESLLNHGCELIDSSLNAQEHTAHSGRHHSLSGKKLIATTSTVEVGVTIPGLTLMIMDPGFTPMSFMQRLGRTARGDLTGRVIVRITSKMQSERVWLGRLVEWAKASGGRVSIDVLTAFMADQAGIPARFAADGLQDLGEDVPSHPEGFYDRLSMRAAFCAGLYWHMLIDRLAAFNPKRTAMLREVAPSLTELMAGWLKSAGTVEGARSWLAAFTSQARQCRNFSPTITVVSDDGTRYQVQESWLAKTPILDECPTLIDAEGNSIVLLEGKFADYLQRDTGWREYKRYVALPYHRGSESINASRGEVQFYIKAHKKNAEAAGSRNKKGMDKAMCLVQTTGIIPYIEDSQYAGGGSGVL